MHQTENCVNVSWLSEQLQRDIHRDHMRLIDEGLVYDTTREEYLPQTKSRVTTQSPTPPQPTYTIPALSRKLIYVFYFLLVLYNLLLIVHYLCFTKIKLVL